MSWRRNSTHCTGMAEPRRAWGQQGSVSEPGCPCQRSCKGEILASRKDYRMNTSTPHLQGTFMLEPQGLFPMDTLKETQGEMRQEPGTSQLPLQSLPAPEEQPMDVCVCASPDPGLAPSCPQDPGKESPACPPSVPTLETEGCLVSG